MGSFEPKLERFLEVSFRVDHWDQAIAKVEGVAKLGKLSLRESSTNT